MNTSPFTEIVYFCGDGIIEWDPADKSLGGSEQAVVQLSERWASRNYIVSVYGKLQEKITNGVSYYKTERFDPNRSYNIFIIWRECGINSLGSNKPKARAVLLDLHDLTPTEKIYPLLSYVNQVMVKSQYHASLFPAVPKSQLKIKPNGILMNAYLELEKNPPKREPLRFCYTASYDRGLRELLKYGWADIYQQLPGSELHVYYGLSKWDPNAKETEQLLKQAGVVHHGRQPNQVVAEEKFRCSLNLYPSHSLTEIDCINVRESALAGCIPILSNMAVFAERDGVHVAGDANLPEFYPLYVKTVVELARNPQKQVEMRRVLRKSDLLFTWDPVATYWLTVFRQEVAKRQDVL
jgi:hypothetical protein